MAPAATSKSANRPTDASAEPGAPREAICDHCGLPVPRGLIEPGAAHQFCCNGCRTVYEMLHACGLDAFYRIRDGADAEPVAAATRGRAYDAFDDPAFADLYVQRSGDDGPCATDLYLEGVHCAACVWLVEKLPRVVEGVIEARLSLRQSVVRVRWNAELVKLSTIARALDSLGYAPHPLRGGAAARLRTLEDRKHLVRLAVAGACAGNTMLVAVALYAGEFDGMSAEHTTLFRWVSMLLAGVALLWPGRVFFRGAWAALRTRTANLDLPIALALGVGGVAGLVNTALGRGDVYFDSLTVLVFLLLVGRFIQHRQQRQANDAIELLFSLTPSSARRIDDDTALDVPIESLEPGDVIEVRAGESIPVDGHVTAGRSDVDAALLSGESKPVALGVGDRAFAGTVNLASTLRLTVDATGMATRAGQLMRLVEQASQTRAPIVQFTDRLGGWFVAIVTALATATFAAWFVLDAGRAADHAIALLIVACPCALGLATPLTLAVAIGRAARRDILIKGAATLERLVTPGTLLLDKTGTLTAGRTSLVRWVGDESARPLAAAIEAASSHPIARAMVEAADAEACDFVPTDVVQHTGGGIEGVVDGRRVAVGSEPFITARGVALPDWARQARRSVVDDALTPVLIAVDGQLVAVAGFGDALRGGAAEALAVLRERGWRLGMLSGDHPDVVRRIAERLDLDPAHAQGHVTPEQKLQRVSDARERGTVVMVGDGVNDAAALGAADVGVAMRGGAEASLAAADVYLAAGEPADLVELFDGAARTARVIRRNLAVSLAYNAAAVALAAAGYITPLLAAVLMPLSSFTVLSLAMSSRTFGGKQWA